MLLRLTIIGRTEGGGEHINIKDNSQT